MNDLTLLGGLGLIMGLVLVLPFMVKRVEEELEAFLLIMGTLAVTMAGEWSLHLVGEVLAEPLKISAAVLAFGFVFRWGRPKIQGWVVRAETALGLRVFLFLIVVGLGLLSSVITAIIASLVLVEVISAVNLDRTHERRIVILTCYSIGLGAVLTPLGEPLSTISTAKLAGPPHNADFFYLARLLWVWVISCLLILGFLGSRCSDKEVAPSEGLTSDAPESRMAIVYRAAKVYVFVAALVLLGHGFTPIIDRYLIQMSPSALYWINMISAALDNATLAAAEISPRMSDGQLVYVLMGLLISGGMLIPGNIPNIICASKLSIKSAEWAREAAPMGLVFMTVCFVLLRLLISL